jgi:3-isopropylmalate/(R)-2-methylmalate dehydratase small subunit
MARFLRLDAIAAPMPAANVDTDAIMPKQFLKGIDREGLALGLFHDLRFGPDGAPDPAFVLNRPDLAEARVLITGPNFGCGSSREHAVWGMLQFGIRAVIGTSFGGIFADNAANNGLLLIALDDADLAGLMAAAEAAPTRVAIDLQACTITVADRIIRFAIDPLVRDALMSGLDRIGRTLAHADRIRAFERDYHAECIWLAEQERG